MISKVRLFTLFILSSFLALGNTVEVKVRTSIKIERIESVKVNKEQDGKKLSYEIGPKKIEINKNEEYIGEIKIRNTGDIPLNLVASNENIEIYPRHLKIEPNSMKLVKFVYSPLKEDISSKKTDIVFKELLIKEKMEKSLNNNETRISIYGK